MNQKKSSRHWFFRIRDILDSIERIETFTKDMTFIEFEKNRMVQDAVIRNFEIIGEAGSHIPNPFKITIHKSHGGRLFL